MLKLNVNALELVKCVKLKLVQCNLTNSSGQNPTKIAPFSKCSEPTPIRMKGKMKPIEL